MWSALLLVIMLGLYILGVSMLFGWFIMLMVMVFGGSVSFGIASMIACFIVFIVFGD